MSCIVIIIRSGGQAHIEPTFVVPIESTTKIARELGLPRSVHSFVLSADLHVDTEREKARGDMGLQSGRGLAGQIEAGHEDWCGQEVCGFSRELQEPRNHVSAPEFCPAQAVLAQVQRGRDPHVPNLNPEPFVSVPRRNAEADLHAQGCCCCC